MEAGSRGSDDGREGVVERLGYADDAGGPELGGQPARGECVAEQQTLAGRLAGGAAPTGARTTMSAAAMSRRPSSMTVAASVSTPVVATRAQAAAGRTHVVSAATVVDEVVAVGMRPLSVTPARTAAASQSESGGTPQVVESTVKASANAGPPAGSASTSRIPSRSSAAYRPAGLSVSRRPAPTAVSGSPRCSRSRGRT